MNKRYEAMCEPQALLGMLQAQTTHDVGEMMKAIPGIGQPQLNEYLSSQTGIDEPTLDKMRHWFAGSYVMMSQHEGYVFRPAKPPAEMQFTVSPPVSRGPQIDYGNPAEGRPDPNHMRPTHFETPKEAAARMKAANERQAELDRSHGVYR